MTEAHFPAAHAVFAYLALDLDDPYVDGIGVAERALAALEPEQLVRVAAKAGQLQDIALALSTPHPDGIPSAAVMAAQREHERAVPQVYGRPTTFPSPIWPQHTGTPVVEFEMEDLDDGTR